MAIDLVGAAATGAMLLFALLLGAVLEYRFGLARRIEILWRRATNAEAKTRLEAAYETDLPFDNVKDEWKSVLREMYGDITVKSDTKTKLDVRVQDHFDVEMDADDGGVTLETSKVVSTMRGLKTDLDELFTALDHLAERNTRQTEKANRAFAEDGFDLALELPHGSKYLTYHLPFGTKLRSQRFVFAHAVADWEVRHEDGRIHLHTGTLEDMDRLTRKVLGLFLVL